MKKCLVLDLDNTLWGGIVGEDGMENLALSLTPPGASFIAFQQAILDLQQRGIILAIASRNNEADALKVIREHPNMILKDHHFAGWRINWNDKATNIRELATELNIGLDSMVFLDDDQTNREMVRALVPEVEVPELPKDPIEYTKFLLSLPYFDTKVVTDEDTMRGNYYVTERLRKEAEKHYATPEDFLKELGLEAQIVRDDRDNIPRLAQLTEKTNQFNVAKQPLTEEEMLGYITSPKHTVYHARLADKFGDYGITALALVEKGDASWHIPTLLMSCRVFGRGLEHALLSAIQNDAESAGAREITTVFQKSEKNAPAEEFITKYCEERDGRRLFTSKIASPTWMQIRHANI